ncbi:MAG TPA: sensor histidine kinase [Pyrinomonadaceae bacterium]
MNSKRNTLRVSRTTVGLLLVVLLASCSWSSDDGKPSIEFTKVPPADKGGAQTSDTISGRVRNARPEYRVVLFARSGAWYVQPYADQPFTKIEPNSTWASPTHLGTEYAALLVEPGYVPPAFVPELPEQGNGIVTLVVVEGTPPFWRSWWFTITLLALASLALFMAYRWHVRQMQKKLTLRFEERLAERTRIAQDLHDTLLQGLMSASMQLHVANDHLPDDSPAKPLVNRVMELMSQVIQEGRDAVRGLRSPSSNTDNLETAFSQIRQQLGNGEVKDYRVIVEGKPLQLHPIIRDEAYRIGREALVNAFHHANADNIEVELEYSPKNLRLIVRDDGAGIDQHVLESGKDGHWGLAGMRERAESIGARLRVWSREHAGTEVELVIPGHIAFVPMKEKE